MNCQDLCILLRDNFTEKMKDTFVANDNELYIKILSSDICEFAIYVYKTLSFPLVSMFANDERELSGSFSINYVFADRINQLLLIIKTMVDPNQPSFTSITEYIPAAMLYEREINDLFGLYPSGHPDAKSLVLHGNWPEGKYPLRKDYDRKNRQPLINKQIEFNHVDGTGVYEIPVGPVHAGIIEPGHFRFSVAGEPIINLEAQLFFVHKGIEKLSEGTSIEKCLYISERISGDESFTNSLAYCQAIEKIADTDIPDRAKYMRVVFAELERLTSHLGDLGGICNDVGYGFAVSQFRLMRIWSYAIADLLCGSRYLRSVNKLGGCKREFIFGKEKEIIDNLNKIKKELRDTEKIIKSNSMFIDRIEHTGILSQPTAFDLNAVGPGGRASGIHFDVRKSFPYAAYKSLNFDIPKHYNGDVNCRLNAKIEECFTSIDLMIEAIYIMPQGKTIEEIIEVKPYQFAFGLTEAPRGENIHWVMTGKNNTIYRYKIRTASYCNWPALCYAVKGNIVPDFPLINKSFNLSYAGNDL